MSKSNLLIPGHYYHIYNRGNNGENIFIEKKNFSYFLKLYIKHIEPVAFTFAYCLLRNHFHFLIRIKTDEEQRAFHETSEVLKTSEVFSPKSANQAHSNLTVEQVHYLKIASNASTSIQTPTSLILLHTFTRIRNIMTL